MNLNLDALIESGLMPTLVKMVHDDDPGVRFYLSAFFNFATASHYMRMIEEIVANDGVAAICTLLSNKNDSNTQIHALTALNNIIRTVEIKKGD